MKPYFEKTTTVTIKGYTLKFRYPNFADRIAIEARINITTRGQYAALSLSLAELQRETADFAVMLATLSICTTFVGKEQQDWVWENMNGDDPDVQALVREAYQEFEKWRDSFRSRPVQAGGQDGQNPDETAGVGAVVSPEVQSPDERPEAAGA